jgi:polar amino acid transport system ATP-binding protein
MNSYTESHALIEVRNVDYKIGQKLILRDIGTDRMPFSIKDVKREGKVQGQIVAVVGRSGRGKSTFFKLLAGLTQPTKGTITIPQNFTDTSMIPVQEGDVGFVQQFYPLSRNQNLVQMLEDAAKQGKYGGEERKEIIDKYLNDWGLSEQKFHSTKQLSGGQRQRVAIIEQLLCSHYFIILDEPFSGLDVKNIEDVKNSLYKINQGHDINTVIFSTHNIEIAVEIADSIYVIGYEMGSGESMLEGGTILSHFDLKQMGLAWQQFGERHLKLSKDLKQVMLDS